MEPMRRLKNISTGFFLFMGITVTGMLVGAFCKLLLTELLPTSPDSPALMLVTLIWGGSLCYGIWRAIVCAASDVEIP